MTRTRRIAAVVFLGAAIGVGTAGLAHADEDDYHDDTGRYYDFPDQDYYDSDEVGEYKGNDGCDPDDYNTDGPNGVDSDNGCDHTRYQNKGSNGNSSPESTFGHAEGEDHEPIGNGLFGAF